MATYPHRTARTIAIAHGAKVPPKPVAPDGYDSQCGVPNGAVKSAPEDPAAEISRSGGTAKLPVNISPFKLGGT